MENRYFIGLHTSCGEIIVDADLIVNFISIRIGLKGGVMVSMIDGTKYFVDENIIDTEALINGLK